MSSLFIADPGRRITWCAALVCALLPVTSRAVPSLEVGAGGDPSDRFSIHVRSESFTTVRVHLLSRPHDKLLYSWADYEIEPGMQEVTATVPKNGIASKRTKWMIFWARRAIDSRAPKDVYQRYLSRTDFDHVVLLEQNGRVIDSKTINFNPGKVTPDGVSIRQIDSANVRGLLFKPPGNGPFPLLISIGGNPKRTALTSSMAIARKGVLVFDLDYHTGHGRQWCFRRVPTRLVTEAIRHLSRTAAVDRNKIGIWGSSRGAEAVPFVANSGNKVRFAIMSTFTLWPMPGGCLGADSAWVDDGRPVEYLRGPWWLLGGFVGLPWMTQEELYRQRVEQVGLKNAPRLPMARIDVPTLLIGAGKDSLVPSALSVETVCAEFDCRQGSRFKAVIPPDASHFVSEPPWVPYSCKAQLMSAESRPAACDAAAVAREQIYDEMMRFIDEQLR